MTIDWKVMSDEELVEELFRGAAEQLCRQLAKPRTDATVAAEAPRPSTLTPH